MKGILFRNSAVAATIITMFVLGHVAGTGNTSAQQLTAADLSGMTQSTASDTDAVLLYFLAGQPVLPIQQSISFNSTATDTSWAGTLSGNYLGQTLNLAYGGITTAGTVTWDTTGTFGGGSVTGGGTASTSYPTSSTFDLTLSDTLGNGVNTYTLNYDIPGSISADGTFMIGSQGDLEVGGGTLNQNGNMISGDPVWYSGGSTSGGTQWKSDIKGVTIPLVGWAVWLAVGNADTWGPGAPSGSSQSTITVASIPEPSTMTLLLLPFGLGAVQQLRKRCRRFSEG